MQKENQELRGYLSSDEWRIVADAEAGDRDSMRGLAELYEHWWRNTFYGDGETRKMSGDPKRLFRLAFQWRVRAAEAGDVESMCWVSVYMVRYREEYGITEEMAGGCSALDWQRRAAEAGDRYAMKWMGDICSDPACSEYDEVEAQRWYEESAAEGCIYAIHELAVRAKLGIPRRASTEQALSWYEKSAEGMDRWWSLAGKERWMAMEDLVTAAEMHLSRRPPMSQSEANWLIEHLDEAEKILSPSGEADRLMSAGSEKEKLLKNVRKTKLKMNRWRE